MELKIGNKLKLSEHQYYSRQSRQSQPFTTFYPSATKSWGYPIYQEAVTTVVGRGVMPSVKLALDHVNEHDSVLRNYRLHMWWNDTEVS